MKIKYLLAISSILLLQCLFTSAYSQNTNGRWAFGVDGGTNIWLNDYNTKKIGIGTNFHLRYGLTSWFSLGVVTGFETLKSGQSPTTASIPHEYLKINSYPISIGGWFNFLSGNQISPYGFIGLGGIVYQAYDGLGNAIPKKETKIGIHIPVGLGVNVFLSKHVAINLQSTFAILDKKTDNIKRKNPDRYLKGSAGFTFFFGTSDDDDDDLDGLTNAEERALGTNPTNPDNDEDGLLDGEEVRKYGTDPLRADTDGDGLNDGEEIFKYHTDPLNPDTDGDGLLDGNEVHKYKTNPLNSDTDGGGVSDGEEVRRGTNPLNPLDDKLRPN